MVIAKVNPIKYFEEWVSLTPALSKIMSTGYNYNFTKSQLHYFLTLVSESKKGGEDLEVSLHIRQGNEMYAEYRPKVIDFNHTPITEYRGSGFFCETKAKYVLYIGTLKFEFSSVEKLFLWLGYRVAILDKLSKNSFEIDDFSDCNYLKVSLNSIFEFVFFLLDEENKNITHLVGFQERLGYM